MSDTPTPAPAKRTYPARRQKVPAFARYQGTSAWKKYRLRARAYARVQAAERAAVKGAGVAGS